MSVVGAGLALCGLVFLGLLSFGEDRARRWADDLNRFDVDVDDAYQRHLGDMGRRLAALDWRRYLIRAMARLFEGIASFNASIAGIRLAALAVTTTSIVGGVALLVVARTS